MFAGLKAVDREKALLVGGHFNRRASGAGGFLGGDDLDESRRRPVIVTINHAAGEDPAAA